MLACIERKSDSCMCSHVRLLGCGSRCELGTLLGSRHNTVCAGPPLPDCRSMAPNSRPPGATTRSRHRGSSPRVVRCSSMRPCPFLCMHMYIRTVLNGAAGAWVSAEGGIGGQAKAL